MSTYKDKVKSLCDEVYSGMKFNQIIIDLVQDQIEEVLNSEEEITRDMVGALAYHTDILIEVYNPIFESNIDWLKRMDKAIREWRDDIEGTNILLGIPKES